MTDKPQTAISLDAIHGLVGGSLHGDGTTRVTALASLTEAEPGALAFVSSDRALKGPGPIRAAALLVHQHRPELAVPQIVVPNPLLAFARVAEHFFAPRPVRRGISAEINRGDDVEIGPDASIWPFVTLANGARIGARVTLYPGVFIGAGSTVGDDSVLHPNVVIRDGCTIGARVTIHGGTVIGADGFGYVQSDGRHHKIPQLGAVVIEDDVEIGANVAIDRAMLGRTVVGRGSKIDNLVQIAHNVSIGEHAIVVAQTGIAGSATIGKHVMIGGQAGLTDHIDVGDRAMIAARAGVNRSVAAGEVVSGAPAMRHETWTKAQAVIPRLPELRQLIRSLERRVSQLEKEIARTK